MITFNTPAGFHDVSEYTFAGDEQQVIVRHSTRVGTPEDLARIGKEYVSQLKDLFGATRADVSEVRTRADGTAYVAVTATAVGPRAAAERSAFVLFRNGIAVHLTLTARPEDGGAEQEFRRLTETIRPAGATPGVRTVGSVAPAAGQAARQAGPVWIDLPGRYQDMTVFTFRNAEGTRHVTVNVADLTATERSAPPAGPLFAGLSQTTDARGRGFAFETGQDPWGARAARTRAVEPGGEERTMTEVRQVGGQRVTVQVRSSEPDPLARQLAEEIARSVRQGP